MQALLHEEELRSVVVGEPCAVLSGADGEAGGRTFCFIHYIGCPVGLEKSQHALDGSFGGSREGEEFGIFVVDIYLIY